MQVEWPEVPIPIDDGERLKSLALYGIKELAQSPNYTGWAHLAKTIMKTKYAAISIVERDRQWFKASCNLKVRQTARSEAFCAYTILSDQMLAVEDARLDSRFRGNPLVTGEPFIRFYAGMPLIGPDGFAIGAVCAFDDNPQTPTPIRKDALIALRDRVVIELELDRLRLEEREAREDDLRQLSMRRVYLELRRERAVTALEKCLAVLRLDKR